MATATSGATGPYCVASSSPPSSAQMRRSALDRPPLNVPSTRGGWQELVVDERLQCVAERVFGVDGFGEPGLAQLDRAHEGSGSFRRTVGEREVRVLVTLADQFAQAQRAKAVLGDYAVQHVGILGEVGGQTHGRIRSGVDTEGFGQRGPYIPPFENVAVRDVERLVGRAGGCCRPDRYVGDKVGVCRFPDERRAAGKAERF